MPVIIGSLQKDYPLRDVMAGLLLYMTSCCVLSLPPLVVHYLLLYLT